MTEKIEPLNPSLSRQTFRYLRLLRRSGVHGKTVSAVARTLIQDQIKALIREGAIKMEFAEELEEGEEKD
jgi:hypothetical protein